MHVILQTWCQIQRTSCSFRYVYSDPGHIHCMYNSAYSGLNIQLNLSALQLGISRQFNVRYTANLVPKYSAHPPVYAMWSVIPDIYSAFTAPHIQASICNWTYLRCYWRYADIWMRVILQTWCQIQRTSSGIPYVECRLVHIQCNYSTDIQTLIFSWWYLRCYWRYHDNCMRVIPQSWCQMQHTPLSLL
jgi:hypothetical protein